jgi:hypothetical protein
MSDLVYQNYNTRCQGWVNPSNLSYGPEIISLSSFQSPAGSSTVVSVFGSNFFSYSTLRFGTFTPTVYFVNSKILQFYVPSSLNSGTFPVQVCNGDVCSNIVNYTIDAASGFWLLDGQNIINSNGNNSGGVGVTWLSRGISEPLSPTTYTISNPYDISLYNTSWITCNVSNLTDTVYLTLPEGTEFTGREIMIKRTGSGSVLTSGANVQSLNTLTTSNIIMNTGPNYNYAWVTIVYNGNLWLTMQGG